MINSVRYNTDPSPTISSTEHSHGVTSCTDCWLSRWATHVRHTTFQLLLASYGRLRWQNCEYMSKLLKNNLKYRQQLFSASETLDFAAMDIVEPFSKTMKGNQYIHVLTNCYSKLIWAIPMSKRTAKKALENLFPHLINLYNNFAFQSTGFCRSTAYRRLGGHEVFKYDYECFCVATVRSYPNLPHHVFSSRAQNNNIAGILYFKILWYGAVYAQKNKLWPPIEKMDTTDERSYLQSYWDGWKGQKKSIRVESSKL